MSKAHLSIVIGGALLLLGAIWIHDLRVQMAPTAKTSLIGEPRVEPAPTVESTPSPVDWTSFQSPNLHEAEIETGERIRLAIDTRRTPPGNWKHIGVRRETPVDLRERAVVSVTLEWPASEDSSSMTASLILSPIAVADDPRSASDWLELSCHGTGVGAGRLAAASRKEGVDSVDYVERSQAQDFEGRLLSRLSFRISLSHGILKFEENDRTLAAVQAGNLAGKSRYLYLVLSSDGNFPLRGVHFRDLKIFNPD